MKDVLHCRGTWNENSPLFPLRIKKSCEKECRWLFIAKSCPWLTAGEEMETQLKQQQEN